MPINPPSTSLATGGKDKAELLLAALDEEEDDENYFDDDFQQVKVE